MGGFVLACPIRQLSCGYMHLAHTGARGYDAFRLSALGSIQKQV